MIKAKDAEAGVWYQHEKYGKVLCCGRCGHGFNNGFVTRSGGTSVEFLRDYHVVTKSLNQSWDAEPETPPLRPIAGESTAKNVNEAVALADKTIGEMVGESLKEFSDRLEAEASGPRSLLFNDVNHYVHMEDAGYEDLQNLCLSLASTLEGAGQPPIESTGEVPQLKPGSSPELSDVGLRVDQYGNVVFRPELVEKTL